jgi:phosphoglycolate phosphatase-like HAD superfamily hydrolase
MTRYRLAIFDFDGTLADSLPWFRGSFQGMIRVRSHGSIEEMRSAFQASFTSYVQSAHAE